jgi:hypothetical protein
MKVTSTIVIVELNIDNKRKRGELQINAKGGLEF